MPTVVVEVVLGIAAGPSGLGWVEADEVVRIVAVIGLAFLLFLAGIELDLRALRGTVLRLGLAGFAVSLALAGMTGFALDAAGLVEDPLLAGVILTATSLGVVIGVLKESGRAMTPTAASSSSPGPPSAMSPRWCSSRSCSRPTVPVRAPRSSSSSSTPSSSPPSPPRSPWRAGRWAWARCWSASRTPLRRSGSAARSCSWSSSWSSPSASGSKTILGAFVAGALVGLIDRDQAMTHPQFRVKLEAIGYGFLIPVFFVASGVTFDLTRCSTTRPRWSWSRCS